MKINSWRAIVTVGARLQLARDFIACPVFFRFETNYL
jgi:hypothetical protein